MRQGLRLQWVNPNGDGTYTSPGEGYTAFVPRFKGDTIRFVSEDGTTAYRFGENEDGSPNAFSLQTGMVRDSSWDIAGLFIPGRLTVKGILASAATLWAKRKATQETMELAIRHLANKNPRTLIKDVVAGKKPRELLSPLEREGAARYYEKAAEKAGKTQGKNAQAGKAYNLERARYLREGGTPPGTLNEFKARTGMK